MASIRKQKSGHWRVWVRRKGKSLTETFVNREDAKTWGLEAERQIDRGGSPLPSRVSRITRFKDLINLHIADMTEVGKPPGRSPYHRMGGFGFDEAGARVDDACHHHHP
jgi:hypothetical protein